MIRRKNAATLLLAIFLAAIFFRLGVWQLDRAQLMQEISKPQQERPRVELLEIAKPNQSLSTDAFNRIVSIKGRFIANLKAPNQEDANGRISTWIIGVFQVAGSGKIAIVRGDESASTEPLLGSAEIVGRLMQSQINNKFGKVERGILPRIDSALLLSDFGSDFFDGYVIAQSEIPDSGLEKVPAPIPKVKVSGFYWQHISYVIIWWMMGILALALPFLRSRTDDK